MLTLKEIQQTSEYKRLKSNGFPQLCCIKALSDSEMDYDKAFEYLRNKPVTYTLYAIQRDNN